MGTLALCSDIFPKFLIFSQNVTSLVYYSHIPIIIISFLLGLFVLLKDKKKLSNQVLFFTLLFFIVWVFLDSVFWAANRSDVIMFVWSMQILFEPLVYIGGLYLVYLIAYEEDASFFWKSIVALAYIPIIIFTPTRYFLSGFNTSSCLSIETNLSYYSYLIEILFTAMLIILAFRRYRKAINPLLKKQIFYIALGVFFFLFSFSWGNIISSFTDNWQLSQIGLFAMPVLIAFLVYSIVHFKTFNIKLIATQALVVSLVILIASQFIFIKTSVSQILNTVTLLLAVFFGYLLIVSVRREIKQRESLEELSTKLEKANLHLADANDKLKSLDKLKTEFLSLASHQLRSPLTAIKGYASMLSEGAFGVLEGKQDEAVKRIYTSAQGLVNVVEDLLNVSKIEQGGMKYEFMPTDLNALVMQLIGEMKIPAENKHLEFKAEVSPYDKFMVNADPTKLKQVFLNLVDNSIKYTQAGFVHISLTRDEKNNTVVFSVKDSGVGISPETKAKLFEKFSRGEGGKLNTGGSGLGLYLAREIARAHKGDVVIDSEGLGKGSTFTVVLPAVGAHTHDFVIPS